MDPHFNEYLAAVAAMRETYGESADERLTEFQGPCPASSENAAVAA